MLSLLIQLDLFIFILVIIAIIIILTVIFVLKRKKYNTFLASIINTLMKNKMENINYENKRKLYSITFNYNDKKYYIKIIDGGKKKGIVMTNPTTIHLKTYSSQYGPATKSEHAKNLESFLKEKFDGIKILLVRKNMLRITKYINENELEEVKYDVPSFNTYIVQEKDFNNYLEYIKDRKK